MITYSAPASRTMGALTSPVYAPSFSQNTSWAATAMGLLRTASATACSAVNGGATTISTSATSLTRLRNSFAYTTASCTVLNIFQFPATSGVRMGAPTLQGCRRRAGGRSHQARQDRQPAACALGPCLFYLSVSAATPGTTAPPRHSSDAPPPVEMCDTRDSTPALWMAATESPPPITVVPFTFATASATASVPLANSSISNTPIGPFHTTVFAVASTAP